MKRKVIKFLSMAVAVVTISSVFVGCGKKSDSSSKGKEIIVWSHLTEPEVDELRKVAEDWGKKTGNTVKVKLDTSKEMQSYLQAANSSKASDIMFGMPHNDLGTFKKAGLLAEVPSDVLDKSKYPEVAVKAVTWDEKQYAVPLALETTTLFVNTDKVKEIPATYDQLIDMAKTADKDGKILGFQYDVKNLYFSHGLIAGNGGYVFKDNNGTLDPNDVGLGNEGAVKAYTVMQDMVQKYKFMPADITGDIAKGNFQNGKIAFYISGPWDVEGFKKAGVNFKVAEMPKINGKPAPNFVGVQSAFVNAKSKNQKEAFELLKYLCENTSEKLLKTGNRIPALTAELEKSYVKENATVQTFAEQAKHGIPMPNIAEMSNVWTPTGDNYGLMVQGKLSPQDAAKLVKEQVEKGIKDSKK